MPAPKGNQFWKLRSKHGRDKLFATADLLWEAACEYFQWCDNNPWQKTDFKGKDIQEVKIPIQRPYTLSGLCLYLDCNQDYFNQFEDRLTDKDKDFSGVITRIREIIYTNKFEGAAVGTFNANIIARDLGLVDKKQVDERSTPPSRSELIEELERLNKELDDE
jgi:hypothetical protein